VTVRPELVEGLAQRSLYNRTLRFALTLALIIGGGTYIANSYAATKTANFQVTASCGGVYDYGVAA
jgi:hypothetical protein